MKITKEIKVTNPDGTVKIKYYHGPIRFNPTKEEIDKFHEYFKLKL